MYWSRIKEQVKGHFEKIKSLMYIRIAFCSCRLKNASSSLGVETKTPKCE